MDEIEQLFLERRAAIRKRLEPLEERRKKLEAEKQSLRDGVNKKYAVLAEEEFTHSFIQTLLPQQNENAKAIVLERQELKLLRCPREHRTPSGGYSRCKLCDEVWDDTPDAHP